MISMPHFSVIFGTITLRILKICSNPTAQHDSRTLTPVISFCLAFLSIIDKFDFAHIDNEAKAVYFTQDLYPKIADLCDFVTQLFLFCFKAVSSNVKCLILV